jgi:hypothetical protein
MRSPCELHIRFCRNVLQRINSELMNLYIYEPYNNSRICLLVEVRDNYIDELIDSLDELDQSYD